MESFGASSLMPACSDSFPQNRSDQQCQYRWLRVLNPDLVKGPWTKEEDQKVSEARMESEHWTVTLCEQSGGVRSSGLTNCR